MGTGLGGFLGILVGLDPKTIDKLLVRVNGWLTLPFGRCRGATLVPSIIGVAEILFNLMFDARLLTSASNWG